MLFSLKKTCISFFFYLYKSKKLASHKMRSEVYSSESENLKVCYQMQLGEKLVNNDHCDYNANIIERL